MDVVETLEEKVKKYNKINNLNRYIKTISQKLYSCRQTQEMAYHKLDSLRSLVILGNLNDCIREINNTNYHRRAYHMPESNNNINAKKTIEDIEKTNKK